MPHRRNTVDRGYGVEAFSARWLRGAFYDRHLSHIVAKLQGKCSPPIRCFRPACAKRARDEKFFYFNKEV